MFAPVTKCHEAATCYNTDGTFTCNCVPGWDGDGFFCNDYDECFEGSHNCHLGQNYKMAHQADGISRSNEQFRACSIS